MNRIGIRLKTMENNEIAEKIFALCFEDDPDTLVIGLKKIGLLASFAENIILIDGAIRVGFQPNIDPVGKAAQIGQAMSGIFWTKIFPNLISEVSKEWNKRQKALK